MALEMLSFPDATRSGCVSGVSSGGRSTKVGSSGALCAEGRACLSNCCWRAVDTGYVANY